MAEVSILVVDNDAASQSALRNLLDSEGWRVRAVSAASEVLNELARGVWNLAIVNASLTDPAGPVFAVLRELAQADSELAPEPSPDDESAASAGPWADPPPPVQNYRRLRVLFLLPPEVVKRVQPILEREGLPYALKPYNLHDLLEKVSDLLLEAGAIDAPIRTIRDFAPRKRTLVRRTRRDLASGAMFASREDYQMSEEEMAEWERQEQEAEERKKRRKQEAEGQNLD
jgi:PleD family two-component response regulator